MATETGGGLESQPTKEHLTKREVRSAVVIGTVGTLMAAMVLTGPDTGVVYAVPVVAGLVAMKAFDAVDAGISMGRRGVDKMLDGVEQAYAAWQQASKMEMLTYIPRETVKLAGKAAVYGWEKFTGVLPGVRAKEENRMLRSRLSESDQEIARLEVGLIKAEKAQTIADARAAYDAMVEDKSYKVDGNRVVNQGGKWSREEQDLLALYVVSALAIRAGRRRDGAVPYEGARYLFREKLDAYCQTHRNETRAKILEDFRKASQVTGDWKLWDPYRVGGYDYWKGCVGK
ncbi:hypothetical protein A2368_04670 [Candidatus Collierbacteria bacterium RIFOXYB1_FULL_49_13]|uniref:Uncharacterized protein n=1 Tax=Candidatus Collierbacteria bacterium RIFOXYB1_FULL_49_13 TaxID=1817728 RepID=A0A1F5FJQ6_9BACT|nr:MAG: hypothetical protein A2368_04670 [Candidatus Collierbacteria bacterium RIFOXYB1_FULL_49_13]